MIPIFPSGNVRLVTSEVLILEGLRSVAVCTVLSYPSVGLGRDVEGGLVLTGEECQGVRRGLVEHGGDDT